MRQNESIRHGFTLIELLVVIAIIAVLVGMLVPAVQKVQETANRAQCQNNLKQIGLAIHNYESVNKRFPPAFIKTSAMKSGFAYGVSYPDEVWSALPGWAWGTLILPYVEQQALYQKLRLDLPVWAPENAPLIGTKVSIFLCPSATGGSDGFLVEKASGDGRHGIPITPNVFVARRDRRFVTDGFRRRAQLGPEPQDLGRRGAGRGDMPSA